MDIAKVTSKGQITIPIDVRRKLKLKEGDKVIFLEKGEDIVIRNAEMQILYETQRAFKGEALKAALTDEDDVVEMIRDIRKGK